MDFPPRQFRSNSSSSSSDGQASFASFDSSSSYNSSYNTHGAAAAVAASASSFARPAVPISINTDDMVLPTQSNFGLQPAAAGAKLHPETPSGTKRCLTADSLGNSDPGGMSPLLKRMKLGHAGSNSETSSKQGEPEVEPSHGDVDMDMDGEVHSMAQIHNMNGSTTTASSSMHVSGSSMDGNNHTMSSTDEASAASNLSEEQRALKQAQAEEYRRSMELKLRQEMNKYRAQFRRASEGMTVYDCCGI